jgi:hypothetical protein
MKLSRTKIQLFLDCPRCFYLDVVQKVHRPFGFPYSLNNAVDSFFKREFDHYRDLQQPHPIQSSLPIRHIPAQHEKIDQWRNSLSGGVGFYHEQHQCNYYGGIDDLWMNEMGEYVVVDYKATAGVQAVQTLPQWADSYVKQLSFYAFLLEKNGLKMSKTGYLLYATAITTKEKFNNQLEFENHLIPVELDLTWIEPALDQLYETRISKEIPAFSAQCNHCNYVQKHLKLI